MNYTEYLEYLKDTKDPLYYKEGKLPQCYIWNSKKKDCVPKTEKDKLDGKLDDKDRSNSGAHYQVWGKTGVNGDGYAYEDSPGTDINASHWDTH